MATYSSFTYYFHHLRYIIGIFLFFFNGSLVRASFPELSFDLFTQEDGLPNNLIQTIYQDKKGWIWVGTSQGLSRFDGYSFVNFVENEDDSTGLKGNLVRVITEDSKGNLLVGTENGGLNVYDREKEQFIHPLEKVALIKGKEISINDIEEDNNGNLYLGTDLNVIVMDTAGLVSIMQPQNSGSVKIDNYVRKLQFDHNGTLWIGTNNGLYTYDANTNTTDYIKLPYKDNQIKEIWEIYPDGDGMLWVGTYSSGLFKVSPTDKTAIAIKLEPAVERSETVRCVSKSVFGDYWIGTRGGLYVYSDSKGVVGFIKQDERNQRSISNSSILSIYNDSQGETWIGTRHGLNLLAKRKQVFHHFGVSVDDNRYLNSSIIYCFWMDDAGKIWAGTEDGGINIYDPETGTYEYLKADNNRQNTLSENCIKTFLDDKQGNLWVGTYMGGIDVINKNSGQITHHRNDPTKKNSLSDDRVWDFCMDRNNSIWVATSGGVDKYNSETKSFQHYPQLNGNEQVSWIEQDSQGNLWIGSLDEVIVFNEKTNRITRFNEYTRSMSEDSQKRIWIATMSKGIALYSPVTGPLKYYNEKNGLANNQALCILEDNEANLWISTSNGLSKFDVEKEYFLNFTSKDGLSNNQFCYGAALKTPSGEMLFGSVSGFNMFNPAEIVPERNDVPIVFTDLKIFNKSVEIGDDKKSILKKSISESNQLTLSYQQNMFTVEFAALNYVNSDNNLYTFMLEGFNSRWSEPGPGRTATYTNLDPGEYILRVRNVVAGTREMDNELQLQITILPPFWKTLWFLIVLTVFILFLIFILVLFFINREKIKNQLVMERVNARKLHELDLMKLKFFTNISHEIRTPLTLILGPVDKILKQDMKVEEIKSTLMLVDKNAKSLNKLINQLLDFRKLESGNLKLELQEGDLVQYIETVVNSFNELAIEKNINLKFNTFRKQFYTTFDPEKIEKIINNLLSNALKFTDANGIIIVNLALIFDLDDDSLSIKEKEKQYIEIVVRDTGRGISEKNIHKIFHRFYQSDDHAKESGTGIGLALVKELVELHNGKIFVSSTPLKGTKFTVRLPYIPVEAKDELIDAEMEVDETIVEEIHPVSGHQEDNLQSRIMLVVEDSVDVRQFIAMHFKSTFKIVEAGNGKTGWDKALEVIPDIIISDVLMPDVDGFEFCKHIKNDERTSHIPLILLTALHSKENEIKGITTGADDYITKPFDILVLQAKIENVLSIRESLKIKFSQSIVLEPSNVIITSPDERFLKRVIEVVEENISNSELDIETFSEIVGISRMQLYRKLHALTNMTVKEFIRHIRLKRAVQLLLQKKMNVSEVAYAVGFNDLSHFRKCFKSEYGMSATEYVSRHSKNKSSVVI